MSARKDVIVVGAGGIGCSIAYHLGRRGISACIVERESSATRAAGPPPQLLRPFRETGGFECDWIAPGVANG
jgi:glycine/D-amino acid oxidase-like deaminating enzyme